uniref:Uncharacterized protein n=1 Tax=Astyanax mexicanus TaxID=7994 RepID=A0A3B1KBP6_ASTMX
MQLLCEIFLILHITIISSEAQPVSSKLHDGWWAYKDAVQGTFIPGKREWVRGKVIELCVKFKPNSVLNKSPLSLISFTATIFSVF